MTDLMLRFPDRETAMEVFGAAELHREIDLLIDVVGVISLPTGALDGDGQPVLAPEPGWHVNVRCLDDRDLSALDPYVVTPANPYRVWA